MTKAVYITGSDDNGTAPHQGVSVITIKEQLTGMLPRISAGSRTRVVISGNAPDSDIYFDDSMRGPGPGTIVQVPSSVGKVSLFNEESNGFIEIYDVKKSGIFALEVSGTYSGKNDATFRIQIANPDDDDVYRISNPSYVGKKGLDDLSVIFEDIKETDEEGLEKVLISSSSYMSAGVAVYTVEIASADPGSADTIRWYKNGKLLTSAGSESVIKANDGNVLYDGINKIVVKFQFDGFNDKRYGTVVKHTKGDRWNIVAGAQQIRWSQGVFDDTNEISITPVKDYTYNIGSPVGILKNDYQYLADGIYIKLPAQVGYPDGTDANTPAPIWEFKVTAANPDAAISAMQETIGKIQEYPDYRIEQRDFGQPKLHNDFDTAIRDQQQISTIEIKRLAEIGAQGEYSRTSKGNTQLYDNLSKNKKRFSLAEANEFDDSTGNPLLRDWVFSSVSSDGSVGPYFSIQSLEGKNKKPRKNHFWFNFGNTSTSNTDLYDDTDPRPDFSDGIPIDVSGRDLSQIIFFGNDELSKNAIYEIDSIAAISKITSPTAGQSYWSNDGGKTLVSAEDVHPEGPLVTWPSSVNSAGNKLYYLLSAKNPKYTTAENAGWNPDIDESTPAPKMSVDINGKILIDPVSELPEPLELEAWMTYHGYAIASITEVDWMLREGYIPYQDALHNKWFTLYTQDFDAYYLQFHVIDNISGDVLEDVSAEVSDNDGKSITDPQQVIVKINRYDTLPDVCKKTVDRINLQIPTEMLDPAHPFYVGHDVSEIFSASVISNNKANIKVREYGKVQECDIDTSLASLGFQCFRKISGNLGYAQKILDNVADPHSVYKVGRCLCIYNATQYTYDSTVVEQYSPHVVWFNLDGDCIAPAGPGGLVDVTGFANTAELLSSLSTYELDEKYANDIDDAFDNERVIPITIFTRSVGNSVSYQFTSGINNDPRFKIPFISVRPSNNNISRILQRDPGPVLTTSAEIPDQACHKVNCDILINNLRPGILTTPSSLRDRDYISDSIVFTVNDFDIASTRFLAQKRIVNNFAKFKIKCVAEQKVGMLFDYSEQTWLDPDPDVTEALANLRKGGTADLSNYETNLSELFNNIPQKEISGNKVWKRSEDSDNQFTASDVGYAGVTEEKSNYDSKNRTLWADAKTPATRTIITTATAQGKEDDEMLAPDWYHVGDVGWENITEDEWMRHEGFLPVPAFTHRIAKAAYFILPHPEKNFYVWFDVGQLSADPGDDGALDSVIGVNLDNSSDISYIGGSVRVAVDSYSTAGQIAKSVANRINSDRYDAGKKFVQVDVDNDEEPIYQQLVAGNLSKYFIAEIDANDNSVVNITCKKSGLINTDLFIANDSLNLPITESGDEFTVSLVNSGDTDFYVDITNKVSGFVEPPVTDVSRPDADTGLQVTVNEIIHAPSQPGLTKISSEFIAYEDMSSADRGYRKVLNDGREIALGGPVSYIEDDKGSLIYPVAMSNVSMKNPDQYDGVIEPLEIRSRASRNSPDAYFAAHDVRGDLQSDVAEDSRKRSNPISQYVDQVRTNFEPYEDGIEHMESSIAAKAFVRRPIFSGTGLNDIQIAGEYSAAPGTGANKYYVECIVGYSTGSNNNDKFRWRTEEDNWSEILELTTAELISKSVLTYDGLGSFSVPGSLQTSEVQVITVPGNVIGYEIKAYARGDINGSTEYYGLQYYDNNLSAWVDIANDLSGEISGRPDQMNKLNHPTSADTFFTFSTEPHWRYRWTADSIFNEEIPLITSGSLKFRVISSPDVTRLQDIKNTVKISFEFQRSAGELALSNGLVALFDSRNGHTAADTWEFDAIAKSHEDKVGTVPLPGYLTWQESKIKPFVESTRTTDITNLISDASKLSSIASASMAFNYPGYSGSIEDTTWEKVYLSSLNGQAFTLADSLGVSKRFEFDNDGKLENDGQIIVSLLRPEVTYIRFPDTDQRFQKRDSDGNLLWIDSSDNEFAAFTAAPIPASSFGYQNYDSGIFSGITQAEWAKYYNFSPLLTNSEDISSTLPTVSAYAGKYFIITDAVDSSKENVNNTVGGGRYAVWFNVIDENGNETTAPTTPFTDILADAKWSDDNGKTILVATNSLDGTGWNPDPETKTMSTNSSGIPLWTYDSGETIVAAPTAPAGYVTANLDEVAWHKYHGYEDYSQLIPQLIKVDINSTDSIKILSTKVAKTIKAFKNKNKIRSFDCVYVNAPEYEDLWDLEPAIADSLAGTWVFADYDNSLKVKLESNWFNQYSYDPNSPPIKTAIDAGWERGYHTIKIFSRNLGYHNITSRLEDPVNEHEPLYTDVPKNVLDVRSFEIINDEKTDWGGYRTFEELLNHTSEVINSSQLDMTSEVIYSSELSGLTPPVYVDVSSTVESGIILTTIPGDPESLYKIFSNDSLIQNVFVRYPTRLEKYVNAGIPTYYGHRSFLCGLKLFQKTPGLAGNKKNIFHHYSNDIKGNIVITNFSGGFDNGPGIEGVIETMNPGIDDMRPHGHKSSTSGLVYDDMPCGTDSIAFGGWKK